ncbi:hypothetical protein Landi51_01868 [Colletotrichum acutatum]
MDREYLSNADYLITREPDVIILNLTPYFIHDKISSHAKAHHFPQDKESECLQLGTAGLLPPAKNPNPNRAARVVLLLQIPVPLCSCQHTAEHSTCTCTGSFRSASQAEADPSKPGVPGSMLSSPPAGTAVRPSEHTGSATLPTPQQPAKLQRQAMHDSKTEATAISNQTKLS